MKIIVIALIVLVLALIAGGAYHFVSSRIHVPDNKDLLASIDKRVNNMFRNQDEHAIVVGLYKQGRRETRLYGVTSKESQIPVSANTVFQIGSITKVFTAYVLQQYVDDGKLTMESTLEELIGESVSLNEKTAKITLHQLITHTSGLPRIPKSLMDLTLERAGKDNLMDDPYTHTSVSEIMDYLATADDAKNPGKFDYSNYGVGLLGHILEQLSGQTLEQLYQEHIFGPFNMQTSGVIFTPEAQALLAQGYGGDGKPAGVWTLGVLGAAGAVYSNTEDMLNFIEASLVAGSDANNSLEKMRIPQASGKTGIGWMQPGFIDKFFGNGEYIWHNGQVGGYVSYIAMNPNDKTGIVVMASRSNDVTMLGILLTRLLRSQSWAG